MKKYIFFVASLLVVKGDINATSFIQPPLNAADIYITEGKTGSMIALLDLSRMKVMDFELQAGKK